MLHKVVVHLCLGVIWVRYGDLFRTGFGILNFAQHLIARKLHLFNQLFLVLLLLQVTLCGMSWRTRVSISVT